MLRNKSNIELSVVLLDEMYRAELSSSHRVRNQWQSYMSYIGIRVYLMTPRHSVLDRQTSKQRVRA